jgi:hypothetical protein
MFAKLTSTNLTTTKLASIRVRAQAHSGLCPEPMLRAATAHANDNRVTPHIRASERPVLSCRWVASPERGLECRWFLLGDEATRLDGSGVRRKQRPVALVRD